MRITQSQLGKQDPLVAEILYRLGRMHFRTRKFTEAKDFLTDALLKFKSFSDPIGYTDKVASKNNDYISGNILRCLHSLGLTHTYLREYDLACNCYIEVLANQKKTKDDMIIDNANIHDILDITINIARTLFDLSLTLKSSGNINDALKTLREMHDILATFKEDGAVDDYSKKYDLHVAILSSDAYNMQGAIFKKIDNHEDALESYRKCLKIKEEHLSNKTALGDEKVDSALSYPNTSNSSNAAFNTAEHKLEIAECMHNIGDMYFLQDNLDEAMSSYENANTIRKQVLGEEHFSSSSNVKNLLRTKSNNHHHMDFADTKNNIGIVCLKKGGQEYLDYALESFLDCLTLRKEVLGEDSELVADIYHNVSLLYVCNSNY